MFGNDCAKTQLSSICLNHQIPLNTVGYNYSCIIYLLWHIYLYRHLMHNSSGPFDVILGTNTSEILFEVQNFPSKKMYFNVLSARSQLFCSYHNVLTESVTISSNYVIVTSLIANWTQDCRWNWLLISRDMCLVYYVWFVLIVLLDRNHQLSLM